MQFQSGLCIGLDPDINRLPHHLLHDKNPLVSFLSQIISSTRRFAQAYKINTAFFEQYGIDGIDVLYRIRAEVGSSHCIIDAKRGDIGNTSRAYAKALFDDLKADAITVAPYMGRDSVEPFLDYENKYVYVLALTSNPGASDFQYLKVEGKPLYSTVIETALSWNRVGGLGFVIGANRLQEIASFRKTYHDVPLLLPGIGAQGAELDAARSANASGPALYNVSRAVLYASSNEDFAEQAALVASQYTL